MTSSSEPPPHRARVSGVKPAVKRLLCHALVCILLAGGASLARANVPGGIIPGSPNVTVTNNGNGTVTMANGIVSVLCDISSASITQINYTYNNGNGTTTTQLLNGGYSGGELYWEYGNFGGSSAAYTLVVDPSMGDAHHNPGDYAELDLLSTSSTNGTVDVHFSMLRGSPGFYVTGIWSHRPQDSAMSIGETRTNIYMGSAFNWMSVDAARNKLMEVGASDIGIAVYGAPQECTLWTNGIYQGLYEDKYKYSAQFDSQRAWGWSSVGAGGLNVGLWDVSASMEYYNGGPEKRELMCHHTGGSTAAGSTLLNMFNGGHYDANQDGSFANGETWTKTYGPYFVYCNNTPISTSNEYTASQALYNDALAQAQAEAPAWPYTWFYNTNYTPPSGRGTVSGQIVISDSGNPNASAANLWVDLVQQPITASAICDFQSWMKPYQFWVQTDANGNFTIPSVISGSNYTLYAFGPGAEGEFVSQSQTGGNPPLLYNLPATPFSVTVTGGSTTNLGTITWRPTRVGPTVFEIGYPDRTARKFKHGDDYWVGDIGPSPEDPAPCWQKFLEFPFDYPNGLTYTVGKSRWSTDWNYVQPEETSTNGAYGGSFSTINFNLASAPANGAQASIYLGLASAYAGLTLVNVNGTNLVGNASVTLAPEGEDSNQGAFYPAYNDNDTTVREGVNAIFTDERLTFPGTFLKAGTNTIVITMNHSGYFADHIMYDYLRLELSGYVPPAPASVIAYPANHANLVCWPVTPGATSYNIFRSTTSGANYSSLGNGVLGPVCGSGTENAVYLDTTATNGAEYYYVVQSANTTGTSANSPQSAGTTPSASISGAAPAAPTGLTATAGNAQVTLNWTASATADYYLVQRSTLFNNGGGVYNTLSTITLTDTDTGTTYTDSSPTNGSTYSYTVSAVNASGASSASTASTAVPVTAGPGAAPTLTAQAGVGQVTLTWSAVPGATGYVVSVSNTHGGPYTLIGAVTELTYPDTGLANDTTYYYVVAATNFGGASANSNEASATTTPAPPASLTATPGNTQVTLTWPSAAGATSYAVGRGTSSGGPYTNIANPVGPSYVDSSLTNGTTYYYVVASTVGGLTGSNSAQANATPISTVPVAPANLTASGSSGAITLHWTASAGAAGYTMLRAVSTGGPYSALSPGVTGTSGTDTSASAGATYYYVVEAANSGGASAYSNQASASLPTQNLTLLTWDSSGANPAHPVDGSGTWDTVSTLWSTGTSDIAWSNGNFDGAIFGSDNGAAGTVTVGAISAGDLIFNPAGSGSYTLSSGTVTLTGSEPAITANANATIGAALAWTGTLAINGFGALTLTASSGAISSPITMTNVTLDLSGASGEYMLGTGTISLANATLVNLTGDYPNTSPTGIFGNPIFIGSGQIGNLVFATRSALDGAAVTGSGTLNLYIPESIGNQFRSDFYTHFDQFAGTVNLLGIYPASGVRFFLQGGAADGSATAQWNIGGTGTTTKVTFDPVTDSGGDSINFGALAGGTNGNLSGGTGTSQQASGQCTYVVGALGLNSTYAGTIFGNAAFEKVGAGTQVLSGSCTYTGLTDVLAGILEITGAMSNTASLTVTGNSVFYLAGGSLSVAGGITNNGTFKVSGASAISLTGTFVNNGVLDLINAPSTLPPNFMNNGTVLTASNVAITKSTFTGATFGVTIQSYAQHTYQLQVASSLNNPSWTNVGSPRAGTGSALTLADPAATAGSGVYRVLVSP